MLTALVAGPGYAPTSPFVPSAQQPRRATRRRLAATVRAATAWDEPFEVTVARPLGIQLAEQPGIGVVVSDVPAGSNGFQAGIAVGDVVLATSATMGSSMWPKNTVDGIEAAIRTRIDGRVRLRLRRAAAAPPPPPWMMPIVDTFEVELRQPLGMVLRDVVAPPTPPSTSASPSPVPLQLTLDGVAVDEAGSDDDDVFDEEEGDEQTTAPPDVPGGVEIAEVAAGGTAAASGLVRPGDMIVATSGTLGDTLWRKSTLEGVLAAISTRLAISPTVTLRLERTHRLGQWAEELDAICRGERTRLSAGALASLRRQRRELRDGDVRGEGVGEAVRALCVPAVARTRDAAQLRAILKRLTSVDISIDARLATTAMGASLRARAPELGIAYFDAMTMSGGQADARAYTALMKVHAAAGRLAEALAVENRMSADRIPLDVRTYNTLMAVCARAGDRKSMLQFFQKITSSGLRPTVESWNVVLSYCAKYAGSSRRLQAEDVLVRMRKSGCPPDVVSYSCVAQACVAAGEAGKCEEVIRDMADDGVQPDLVFTNTVLDGYARQLKYYSAFDFLLRMQSKGVQPDATSFAHVLRACVGARVPSQAARAVTLMREAGLQPDVRIYSMLLSAYAKAGKLNASLKVLKLMRQEGVKPNGHVYAGLMEACVVARQPGVAQDLFDQMTAQAIRPDAVTYTLLVRAILTKPSKGQPAALGPSENPARAAPLDLEERKLRLDAAAGGGGGGANAATSASALSMQPRRAYDLLKRMRREGMRPTAVTYQAFLSGCAAFGAYELAITALGEMLAENITPTRAVFESIVALVDAHEAASTPESRPAEQKDGANSAPRPPPSKAIAAKQLAFLWRIVTLFEERRLPLHADVYMPMLRAAHNARDTEAARDLISMREDGEPALFPLRQNQRNAVLGLEEEVESWLASKAERGVAA